MIILAIDPGYDRVGVAIIDGSEKHKPILIYSTCITTDKKDLFSKRILTVGTELESIIKEHTPTVLAIETLFFNSNQKTALLVSEARGVMLYIAEKYTMEICEYTPLQIKNAVTGYGRATKTQVDHMTRQLIEINHTVQYDDEMDAIATGLTCEASYSPK